jgi:hypothetical protein
MRRTAVLLLITGLLAIAPTAYAAKPSASGGGKGGGGKTTGSSSMTLVLVDSTDGVPHWGQHIRFDVSTTATTEPHVSVACSQGGTLVYTAQTGYYASYPWPSTQTFTLSSSAWTGGDADCSARLYSLSNSGSSTTLATMSFHVYA